MLPSVLAGEGPAAKQRMGDALTHGKLRLAGLAPPSGPGIAGGDGNTRNELYLWHYFGDPTMQMFGGGSPPIVFNPAQFRAIYKELPIPKPGDPPPFFVELTLPSSLAGQPISLLRNGQVIGKAIAGDGSVQVPATFNDGPPAPGELEIALEADGAAPIKLPVAGVPIRPPDLVVTELTPSSITVRNAGTGAAGPFKATIVDSQPQTVTLSFAGLAAGASATQSYSCGALLRQRVATVDSDAQVAESNEANNQTLPGIYDCPGTGTGTTSTG
jgi:CARDB protein